MKRAREPAELAKIVRSRLREMRNARGLTQERIAAEIHVSPQHYHNVEVGARGVTLSLLERLARFYRVPPAVFLEPAPKASAVEEPDEALVAMRLADLGIEPDTVEAMLDLLAGRRLRRGPRG